MGSYAVTPFGFKAGIRLSTGDELLLARWIELNHEIVRQYWDGEIEYTEDALSRLRSI